MIDENDNNPFVGLRPFESNESLLFFGRQDQTLALMQRLHQYHFVAVTGSSGCGKSSLIRAGLIPRLKAGYMVNDQDRWSLAIMKPGQDPVSNLANALWQQIPADKRIITLAALIENIMVEGVDALLSLLHPLWKDNINFFLLVDQFEELFRFVRYPSPTSEKDNAIDFVNLLLELSNQNRLPIYIVITMRSDFIGDCAQFYGLPEAMNQSQYIVPRLTRVQLKSTIEGPVKLYKGRISAGLILRLLNDLNLVQDELPLLQHALMRIWNYEQKVSKNGILDLDDYEKIGGIEKALSMHADEALEGMSIADISLTKKMFQALTAIDDHGRKVRRPVSLHHLEILLRCNRDKLFTLINRFITDSRSFLVISKSRVDSSSDWIDISHESLIRQWHTLNSWVDEEADSANIFNRLSQSAFLYQLQKKDLLSGNELQQALQWYHQFQPSEAWAQQYDSNYLQTFYYLQQSKLEWNAALKEKERQRLAKLRTQRLLLTAVIFIALAVSGFAYFIFQTNKRHQRELALNYWKTSHFSREEHNFLAAYLLIGAAADLSQDQTFFNDLMVDEAAFQPLYHLKQILSFNQIVTEVAYSPNDQYLMVVTNDGNASLIEKSKDSTIHVFHHNLPVNYVAFTADGQQLLTASNDSIARVWNIASGKLLAALKQQAQVTAIVSSPNKKWITTGTDDGMLYLWDFEKSEIIQAFKMATTAITHIVFALDGRQLAACSTDGTLQLMDITSKGWMPSFSINENSALVNVAFNSDGQKIVLASTDSTATIWDVASRKPTFRLKHNAAVTTAIFSPDDQWVLTSCKDKTVRIWNTATGKQSGPQMLHNGPVYSLAINENGNEIISGGQDKEVRVWNFQGGLPKARTYAFPHNGYVNSAVLDKSGKNLLTASSDGTATVWNVTSGKKEFAIKKPAAFRQALFTPDEKEVVAISDDSTSGIWNRATNSLIVTLRQNGITSAAFILNKQLYTTSEEGVILKWKNLLSNKRDSAVIAQFSAAVNGIDVSGDGKKVVVAVMDSSAYVLRVANASTLHTFKHDDFIVSSAHFSVDGKSIVTGSWDKSVRLWNVNTGEQIGPNMKLPAEVNSAYFNPDGRWIVSAGWDSTTHLWSTLTMKEIGLGRKYGDILNNASFSADGKWLVIACRDSNAYLSEIIGDFDMPADLNLLQTQALTGTQLNVETGEPQCLLASEWKSIQMTYDQKAEEHYRNCQYPQYNIWHYFHPVRVK